MCQPKGGEVDVVLPGSPLALRPGRKRSLSPHYIDGRAESYGNVNHSVKVFLAWEGASGEDLRGSPWQSIADRYMAMQPPRN